MSFRQKISSTVAVQSRTTAAHAQTGASIHQARGSASLTIGSMALRAIYATSSAGLHASISILDKANPNAVLFQEEIVLREGQQRVIELPRRGGTTIRLIIKRNGNEISLAATGELER